jgi:hypothetical protein
MSRPALSQLCSVAKGSDPILSKTAHQFTDALL